MSSLIPTVPLHTPVLFIAFNREGPARKVLEAIREAKPPRLYFACDGPRNEGERERCENVRALVSMVDWDCQVFTRFSDQNHGVMHGEVAAMDWFFEHEEEGIILEDDTCPVQSFFWYCQEMLEKFRNDDRVWCIMGNNHMPEWKPAVPHSYYYSAHGYGAYWGWAGWRRVWEKYDVDMKVWPAVRGSGLLDGHFLSKSEMAEAYKLFDGQYKGAIRSWDYQMDLARILNRGVTCISSVNLVHNIGFGADGTHTVSEKDRRNKRDQSEMAFPLVHPEHMVVDLHRDKAYFEKYIQPSLFRQFKDALKGLLPEKVDQKITPFLSKMQRHLGIN
ncbi:MAG: hypothetical protein ACOH13_07805 [Flavobacteriales bacterium]